MKTANRKNYISVDTLNNQNINQCVDYAKDFINISSFSENITGNNGIVYGIEINNKIIFSGNEIEIKTFLAGCLSNLTTTNK